MRKLNIVFVCLGNYCRSPMAEAVFKKLALDDGLLEQMNVSSAGTKNWDVGLKPDHRAIRELEKHHYPHDPEKRAQQINKSMHQEADYLIAMSRSIAQELGNGKNIHLLLDFASDIIDRDIPDPYPTDTFPQAFDLIEKGVKAFYNDIKRKHFKED